MRKLSDIRQRLLSSTKQFDDEAVSEVVQFLIKYPSDTPYKINIITINDTVYEYSMSPMDYNEVPLRVASYFIFANFMLKYEPKAPQLDRVELTYNFGKHRVIYDPHRYRLYYRVGNGIGGYEK